MNCLGCQRCEEGPMVKLIDGRHVCDFCPDWKLECEARELLALPLAKRQGRLAKLDETRGKASTDQLRAVMTAVFNARKAAK